MTREEVLEHVKFHGELRGLSPHTIKSYCEKAKAFQNHFAKPATKLDVTHIQSYLHYLLKEREQRTGSINVCNSALRFLYNVVLDTPLNLHKIPCHRKTRGFPDILTRDEVTALFDACSNLRDRCMLMTAYSAGLRVGEVAALKVSDVDSENMQIFIRNGKGGKDRFAILSDANLEILRQYWLAYRPKEWLFSSVSHHKTESHISRRGIQDVLAKAKTAAGITKRMTFHTLRHTFATHLLENGVSIYTIKQLLGHADISTTSFYCHLVKISQLKVKSPLDSFYQGTSNG